MYILITGASGSGTTTLAHALGERLGWPAIDTDDYFWLPTTPPYRDKREPQERLCLILERLSFCGDAVVSGSVMGWGAALENAFDLIVFLYVYADTRARPEPGQAPRVVGAAGSAGPRAHWRHVRGRAV
jgi:adenylate kinase family enzyme